MYLIYVGDQFVHDAYSDDRKVHDGKLSGDVNTFLTLEFTVPPTNPMAKSLIKRDYAHPVTATFDGQRLFRGYIETTEEQLDTEVKVTCKGDLAMLNDSIVRPYTTQQGDTDGGMQYIGQGYETLFKWFINQHNANVVYRGADGQEHGTEKQFQIRYPSGSNTSLAKECAILDKRSGERPYSQSKPTTLSEIQSKITKVLGAYLQLWYDGDVKCLALYADAPEVLKNDQVIQFGRNMTDYMFEDSCVDTYTAIRAQGGNDANGKPVTLKGIADGVKSSAYYKRGDVVYHMANVEKYGYREYAWSNSDITDANALLGNAIVQLQKIMTPAQSIDVSAMDMVFVSGKYKHLMPGQLVTVQSYAHHVDVELLVSSCNIDFDSPDSTKYTMGSSAAKITKTYGSIMEEITVAADTASGAITVASNAEIIASTAQQAAQQATTVTVGSQGPVITNMRRTRVSANTGDILFTPSDGISVVSAKVAATGSMRQLYLVLHTSSMIQSMQELGTLHNPPAVASMLVGNITGIIGTNGVVVASNEIKADSEINVGAVYMIGVNGE